MQPTWDASPVSFESKILTPMSVQHSRAVLSQRVNVSMHYGEM